MTDIDPDFRFGNIIRSSRARGVLYDLGQAVGIGITACNAGVAYLITQGAVDGYPLWLGTATVVYPLIAAYVFGISKANVPR